MPLKESNLNIPCYILSLQINKHLLRMKKMESSRISQNIIGEAIKLNFKNRKMATGFCSWETKNHPKHSNGMSKCQIQQRFFFLFFRIFYLLPGFFIYIFFTKEKKKKHWTIFIWLQNIVHWYLNLSKTSNKMYSKPRCSNLLKVNFV